jgi:DNA-binding beta-propeller fold protein YncE/4-amino-4-deoxy-L-arabinose transferase-like glycosyltransferase
LLALLLNLFCVVRLCGNDYDSRSAALGWLASLVLLAAVFAGDRARKLRRDAARGAGIEERSGPILSPAVEIAVFLAIFALAFVLRLYRLGDWTGGMHGDEGEVGMDAIRILRGHPAPPFRTGWFGQPNIYYWSVALGMRAFGMDLAGLRMFSALAGSLILLPLYPLARQLFGVRTAILASLFVAISDVAIHFSRQEFSNITTPLLLVTGFFLFFRGLRDGRRILFVLAGYAHVACLYFYLGGRLSPIVGAAFIGYLLVLTLAVSLGSRYRSLRAADPRGNRGVALVAAARRELLGIRPFVFCVALYAAGSLALATPWIAYYRDHRSLMTARVREKLVFNHPELMANEYSANHGPLYLGVRLPQLRDVLPCPIVFERTTVSVELARDGFWPRVFWGQLKRTLSVLTWQFDQSGVYTFTKEPVTKPIEATLVVLGIAWALWRWRDTRMALLSIWFWLTILVGGVLTIDAPYMARLVGIIPVLGLFAAVVLDKLAAEAERVFGGAGRSPRVARLVSSMALLALAAFLTWQNTTDYFVRYLGRRPFTETTGQACFVRDFNSAIAREGRRPPKYYELGAHFIYWGHGVNRFLNYGVSGRDVPNPSESLPILDNEDRDAVFMVWSVQEQYLPLIRAYYPGGQEDRFRYGPPGEESQLFTYYRVKAEQIQARRALEARYVPARGAAIERGEGSFGSGSPPPDGLAYPVRARWKGNLIVPVYGRYRLRLESSGPARLVLDDEPALVARGGGSLERDVVLALGAHGVSLEGALRTPDSRVLVGWALGDSEPAPVPRRFLWSGAGGSLLGEVRPLAVEDEEGAWRTPCAGDALAVTQRRLDAFVGLRDAPGAFQSGHSLVACWKGDLRVVTAGLHRFESFSNGSSRLTIDGKPVVNNRHRDGAPEEAGGQVELSAGTHHLELQYFWVRGHGYLEVYWTPPGGERAILGGDHLSVKGGFWPPAEVAEPATPAPQLIQDAFLPPQPAPASDARGCALDARRELYVADTEHGRVAVLDESGKIVRSWGTRGRGPGEFLTVEDVSLGPDGMVYVLDSGLARVQVFTPDGRLQRSIDSVGCSPAGFTVGADGSVYVASTCENLIRRFSPSGGKLSEYRAGSGPTRGLEQPVDVAAGPGGVLYVADLKDRIVKLDTGSDTIVKIWPVSVGRGFGGANLAFDGRYLYLTDPDRSLLYAVDTETGRIEALPAGSGSDLEAVARRAGAGPCAGARALGAYARFPLCLGELLARCRDGGKRSLPR